MHAQTRVNSKTPNGVPTPWSLEFGVWNSKTPNGVLELDRPLVKTLLKGDALMAFEAAETTNGTVTSANFEKCLNDVTKHMFPEKSVETQKRYMRHNLCLCKGQTVKEWVSRVFELNEYLLEFPKSNENPPQKLDDAELMDILEYGIPYSWRQEFAIHGFDLVEEGMKNSWNFALDLSLGSLPLRKQKQPMKPRLATRFQKKAKNLLLKVSKCQSIIVSFMARIPHTTLRTALK